jgi:hypothetical protein
MTNRSTPITIDLPAPIAEQLEEEATRQKIHVRELVREIILEHWSGLPSLPDDVEAELAAFHQLSDNLLWLIARTTLTVDEQAELADLNDEAQSRYLSHDEEARRDVLLEAYDRVMLRRAQAAAILQSRGYDLSDPSVLKP